MIGVILSRLRGFLAFWYEFVVGDDWRIAAGVVAALAATYAAGRTSTSVWWIPPVAVVLLLGWSLERAVRRR